MTDEAEKDQAPRDEADKDEVRPARRELLPLPGLAAISLYLLVLAGVISLGVVDGRHYPPLFLLFAAAFMACCCCFAGPGRWLWLRYSCWRATTCGSFPPSISPLPWCRGF
jgi:hypothetical protein